MAMLLLVSSSDSNLPGICNNANEQIDVHMYVCMYVYICMYVCVSIRMYLHVREYNLSTVLQ